MSEIPARLPESALVTRKVEQVDDLHGELVADPYRWLEDVDDPETARWVVSQNDVTEAWLAQLPELGAIRSRLSELWDYPRFDVPFERGGSWFQTRNPGLKDQAVLHVAASPDQEGRVLLDPNLMSEDGTVSVAAMAVTDDGSLLAYSTSEAGSDWMTWRVRDVASGLDLPDVVEWSKYGSASWRGVEGFYYTALEPPVAGAVYSGQSRGLRICFHALGTPSGEDEIVFEAPGEPEWIPAAQVSEDGCFCVISITEGTAPETQVLVLDLSEPSRPITTLVSGFACKATVAANLGTTFFVITDDSAERQRMVAIDLEHPGRADWQEIIPEREAVLLGARNCGRRLVCHFLEDACSRLSVFEFDGTHVRDIPLPSIAALRVEQGEAGVEGRPDSDLVHFGVWSFADSGSLWSHDIATGATLLCRPAAAPIDQDSLVSEQVFVPASDGAVIPLFLTHRRDVTANGDAAVLLVGYGGFDISMTPAFSRAGLVFAERGGVYAVAALRGGGEYGRSWHDAGRLANKQRVFDDFCDSARWLASSGWSRPGRIAINGASNGGLLVGACLTQHPELFGAAVPEVGVLDMFRFHLFTIGWAWKSDFGDPEDAEQYQWLRAYSPLHNIDATVRYPPTLVMTGDHDDRVVPSHSFKFAAALQAARAERQVLIASGSPDGSGGAGGPILIRIETAAGHGHGKPTSKMIAERADMLAFVEFSLGQTS
ncbi:MAG: prolyl oligopeptidase family serine peptidase [Acidimicrobiales bacterium]